MGFFSDIAGSVVGGLIGGFGDKKASGQLDAAALQAAGLTPQMRNFPTRTALGSTGINGKPGVFFPGYQGQQLFQNLGNARAKTFQQFNQFSRPGFAERFFDSIDKLESRREAQSFNNFESALFNKAGVHTGTQRQVADYQNDIDDARFRRGLQAELASYDVQGDLFNRFLQSAQGLQNLQRSQLDQIGMTVRGESAPLGINQSVAQQGFLGAGATRARSTQDFFGTLGGIAEGAISTGFGGGFGRGGAPTFNALLQNNPFHGVGPLSSFGNR